MRLLPYAHNPSRCVHIDRFNAILGDGSTPEQEMAAGCAFYNSLAPRDFERCLYHDANWTSIAAASAELVAIPSEERQEALYTAADSLGDRDGLWLHSLFANPIVWSPEDIGGVTNGQHRICALRSVGSQQCPVDVPAHVPLEDLCRVDVVVDVPPLQLSRSRRRQRWRWPRRPF